MKKSVGCKILLVVILVLISTGFAPMPESQPAGTWEVRSTLPEARSGTAAVVLGEFIYVLGGANSSGQVLNRVDRYHPASNTWSTMAPMDRHRVDAAATVWNGTIVVMGGRSDENETLNKVEQYDPATGQWTDLDNLDESREGLTAVVLSGTLYAIGGSDENGQIYSSVEQYNPTENDWEVYGGWQLDLPRASFATVAIGDSAFVIGGFNTFGPLGPVQRYHPTAGSSSRAALMPARGSLAAVQLEQKIYAMGGIEANNEVVDAMHNYSPQQNQWRADAPLNTARARFSAASLNGTIYVFGGENEDGNVIGSVEAFTPGAFPLATNDSFSTDEDISLTINVLQNDSDPEGGTLSVSSYTRPSHGTLTENTAEGSFNYTPNQDFSGADQFTYEIINSAGNAATGIVSLTVNPVNDPPSFISAPVMAGVVDVRYEYLVQVDDVDSNTLTISEDLLPDWLALQDNGDGTALLSGTPQETDMGNNSVALRASDGVLSANQSFTLTVVTGSPAVPELLSPATGAEGLPEDLFLVWNSFGAIAWDIQFSADSLFTTTLVDLTNLPDTTYEISGLDALTTYYWRVRASNAAGTSSWSSFFRFTTAVDIANEDLPEEHALTLHAPYPNPFSATVWVEYDVPLSHQSPVRIAVFDARGRQVATLLDEVPFSGTSRIMWNGTNDTGQTVASGLYYIRLTSEHKQLTKSVVLIR